MHHILLDNMWIKLKDFPQYKISKQGFIKNCKTGHILKPVTQNGYLRVRLSRDGKVYSKSVHKLVYTTFKGEFPKKLQINHIDGIRSNNSLFNLELCTQFENIQKCVFKRKGSEVNTSKLNDKQVMDIRTAKQNGISTKILAQKYNLNKSSINRIATGKSWKHLPILSVDNSIWDNPKVTGKMAKQVLKDKYGNDYFSRIAQKQKFKRHCPTCQCGN